MKEIHSIYVVYEENKKIKTLISPFFDQIENAAGFFKDKKIVEKNIIFTDYISINTSNRLMNTIKQKGSLIPIIRYELEIYEDGFYNSYEAAFINENYKKHSRDKDYFKKEFKKLIHSLNNNHNNISMDFYHLIEEEINFDENYLYFNYYKYKKNTDIDIPNYLNDLLSSFYEQKNGISILPNEFDFPEDYEEDQEEELLDNYDEINFDKNFFNDFQMDMNRSFFYMNHPEWREFASVIDQLLLRNDLYYIVENSASMQQGTFGEDNKSSLYSFLNNNLKFNPDSEFLIIITQFTNIQAIDSNLPVKRVAGAVFNKDGFNPINPNLIKETLNDSRPDNLKNKNDLKSLSMEELLSFLKIKID